MSGFAEGIDRSQSTLFPAVLDDYVAEDNPVRAVDAFVEGLDLGGLGFGRAERTRSRASETALSGKPTMVKAGIPGATWTCTSTGRTSMPSNATVDTRWTISPSLPVSADTTGSAQRLQEQSMNRSLDPSGQQHGLGQSSRDPHKASDVGPAHL